MEWTETLLAEYRSFAGDDPRVRRQVVRKAFSEYGEEEWALPDFLAAITDAVNSIPEDDRPSAKVELSGGYEESTELKITYVGLETDAEMDARIRRFLEYRGERLARERAEYERLKHKYEGAGQ